MSPTVLLDVEGALGPEASRTHLPFAFDLAEGTERLELELSYDPARLEDEGRSRELAAGAASLYGMTDAEAAAMVREGIPNFLTLSLDGPEGFRGCAHRHGHRQRIRVGESGTSPGFAPGPLDAGRWRATISVHCVATERCEYRLRVSAR